MPDLSSLLQHCQEIIGHLFNSRELLDILGRPDFTIASFLVLNLVIFTETGLFFCLPGDSLLVTAGLVCANSGWSLPLLLGTLCVSAIVGDSVGYYVGWRSGPALFRKERSLLFARDHLVKAQHFYERHGGKTIVLARFIPVIRTFAPMVAGAGRMRYRRFLSFNILGGVGWVFSTVLIGYKLRDWIDPPLQRLLGDPGFTIRDHIETVIVIVVLLSIAPGILAWWRARRQKKHTKPPTATQKSTSQRVAV
jgi:membrane-associated protein